MKLTVREIRAVKLPPGAMDKVYFDSAFRASDSAFARPACTAG